MDKKRLPLLLFLAATGYTAGVFFELYITGSGKVQLMELLTDYFAAENHTLPFLRSILQNFCSGLPFLLSCFFMPSFPFLMIPFAFFLFLQNLLYGISASLLVETLGFSSGFLYVLTGPALSALLRTMLFAYTAACFAQWNPRRSVRSSSGRKKALRFLTGPEGFVYAALLAALLFISLLQTILLQAAI